MSGVERASGFALVPVEPSAFTGLAEELLAAVGEPLGSARAMVDEVLADLPRYEWTEVASVERLTDGRRSIIVETTVDRKEPMEGCDRATAARIEGLPGGAVLRARGFGDLRDWTLEGRTPEVARIAEAWERALLRDALRRGRPHDQPEAPPGWVERARALREGGDARLRREGATVVAPGAPPFGLGFSPRYGTYCVLGPLPEVRDGELRLERLSVATAPGRPVEWRAPSLADLVGALTGGETAALPAFDPDERARARRELDGWLVRWSSGRIGGSSWRLRLAVQRTDGRGVLARLESSGHASGVPPGGSARWSDIGHASVFGALLGPRDEVVAAGRRVADLLERLAWREPAALLRTCAENADPGQISHWS